MDPEAELVVSEAELSVTEAELGADFITVELDTQPIEYVVKWAEVGSKFTISCLKTDQSELNDALKREDSESELTEELRVDQSELQMDAGDSFLAPYEEVYCDPCDPCEVTHSVEVRTDWDSDSDPDLDPGLVTDLDQSHMTEVVLESSQPDSDQDPDQDQSESEERQHRCSYCGKVYSHASSLYRHQQRHTGKTSAKRTTHETRPHTCPHCGLSFKGSRMLGSHLRLHGKRRIHPCNICGKEFNHSSSLSRHRLIHKKGKGLGRDHPKMATPQNVSTHSNMAALHQGVARKHRGKRSPAPSTQTGPGQKLYACPQCDMSFKTSTQLSKHQVTHVKALLGGFPPKDKENLSESQSDLKIRLKLCSQPNVYALCEKRRRGLVTPDPSDASDPSDVEGEGEGPGRARGRRHGCSQCGRRFGHASALTRHLQKHLKPRLSPAPRRNSKTYTCLTCGKVFLHSSSFSRHKRAHREQQQRVETAPLESESE